MLLIGQIYWHHTKMPLGLRWLLLFFVRICPFLLTQTSACGTEEKFTNASQTKYKHLGYVWVSHVLSPHIYHSGKAQLWGHSLLSQFSNRSSVTASHHLTLRLLLLPTREFSQ